MGDSFFNYLSAHPEDAAIFNGSMAAYQTLNAPAVVNAYDFSAVRTVMDVGGGTGTLMAPHPPAHPAIRGAIYEMPHVAKEARERLASLGLKERCDIIDGDFFASIPQGQDVYILSQDPPRLG